MNEKYYDILGVDKNANSNDIKKAYRSLSLKYHPDRNKDDSATETYKKINMAYETLSDDDKKDNMIWRSIIGVLLCFKVVVIQVKANLMI